MSDEVLHQNPSLFQNKYQNPYLALDSLGLSCNFRPRRQTRGIIDIKSEYLHLRDGGRQKVTRILVRRHCRVCSHSLVVTSSSIIMFSLEHTSVSTDLAAPRYIRNVQIAVVAVFVQRC